MATLLVALIGDCANVQPIWTKTLGAGCHLIIHEPSAPASQHCEAGILVEPACLVCGSLLPAELRFAGVWFTFQKLVFFSCQILCGGCVE